MKRTFARKATTGGRKVLRARRARGRKKLCA
jgi:large subunit ribosomal protein L34